MSKSNNVPPKAAKILGIGQGAKKPTGVVGGAMKVGNAIKSGSAPKPTTFKTATPKVPGKMKPTSPIIGTNRGGTPANFKTINKERMKGTIKELGM